MRSNRAISKIPKGGFIISLSFQFLVFWLLVFEIHPIDLIRRARKTKITQTKPLKKSYGQKKFEALKKVCCFKSEALKSAGENSKFGSFSAAILFQFPLW